MDCGQLDRPITIKKPVKTRNSYGEEIHDSYTTESSWAKIVSMSGAKNLNAETINSFSNTVFLIRYTSFITEECLITYNSIDYRVYGINEVGRGDYLTVLTHINKDF